MLKGRLLNVVHTTAKNTNIAIDTAKIKAMRLDIFLCLDSNLANFFDLALSLPLPLIFHCHSALSK